jgi:hypothetical protein
MRHGRIEAIDALGLRLVPEKGKDARILWGDVLDVLHVVDETAAE